MCFPLVSMTYASASVSVTKVCVLCVAVHVPMHTQKSTEYRNNAVD